MRKDAPHASVSCAPLHVLLIDLGSLRLRDRRRQMAESLAVLIGVESDSARQRLLQHAAGRYRPDSAEYVDCGDAPVGRGDSRSADEQLRCGRSGRASDDVVTLQFDAAGIVRRRSLALCVGTRRRAWCVAGFVRRRWHEPLCRFRLGRKLASCRP